MQSQIRTVGLVCFLAIGLHSAHAGGTPEREQGPVYLAYAGPYSASPSSAFGHLILVLASSPDEPIPLWDVVSFGAETLAAGPVRYFAQGIFGGFLGRYQRVDFHEKTREYEFLEDRDLWLLELNLTPALRHDLEKELSELEGRWFPYSFFGRNCAYYLQALLSRLTQEIPPPVGIVSPIGVFDAVLNTGLAGAGYFRPAASRSLEAKSRDLPPGVAKRFRRDDWKSVASDTTWLGQLSREERRFAQEFFAWKARYETSPLGDGPRAGIEQLRIIDAPASSHPSTSHTSSWADPTDAPLFHRYSRFTFSYLRINSQTPRIAVRFRGAMHDVSEPPLAHRPLNSLELLALEASIPINGHAPRLDEVILFSQRSLVPSDWVATRYSWLLEMLGRRGGLYGIDRFHLETRIGLGRTLRLHQRGFAYGLLTASLVGTLHSEVAIAPGWETGMVWLPATRWRGGIRWTREHSITDRSRYDQRLQGWLRRDLGQAWGIGVKWESGRSESLARIGIEWYP